MRHFLIALLMLAFATQVSCGTADAAEFASGATSWATAQWEKLTSWVATACGQIGIWAEPVKEKILGRLWAEDPGLAAAVQLFLVRFEQAGNLDKKDLNVLLNAVSVENFALTLKEMPAEFIDGIRPKLPDETWRMMHEYMRLAESKSPAQISEIRAQIAEKLYQLREEGRISIPVKAR